MSEDNEGTPPDKTDNEHDSSLSTQNHPVHYTDNLPELEFRSSFKRFLHHDMVGSGFLLLAAVIAVIVANSQFAEAYHHFWETPVGFVFGEEGGFTKNLHHWVNDGLMAIFFFLIGLEIKRELMAGELNSPRKALLPAAAAIGGMVIPALIYVLFNHDAPTAHGWGIPMATDIAFAAGCIALLKKWVPPALIVFLVALAIVDDLGAVAVIAIFYTDKIDFYPLIVGGGFITISFCIGQLGVRRTWPYVLIGILVWLSFLQSGVHATIAGILLAFTIPHTARYHTYNFRGRMDELLNKFDMAEELWDASLDVVETELKDLMVNHPQQELIRDLNQECHFVESPLQRIEYTIEPISVFIIMPIFAFANAGVHLELGHLGDILKEPITLGIIFGLCVGKPLGITLATYALVKTGLASLPRGVNWTQIIGVGCLAGIGFTMSLFVNGLAFLGHEDAHAAESFIASGKIATFIASIVSAILGLIILKLTCRTQQR